MTNKKWKRRLISKRNNDDETDEEKKEDKIEEELNTDWTRDKLTASLQLTAGRHVTVSIHGCSWNDRH